jgi:hypothetical protein
VEDVTLTCRYCGRQVVPWLWTRNPIQDEFYVTAEEPRAVRCGKAPKGQYSHTPETTMEAYIEHRVGE